MSETPPVACVAFDASNESTLGNSVFRILVLGSGGREHALAWRLQNGAQDVPRDDRAVWVCPGNAGIALEFPCIDAALTPHDVVRTAKKERIDLVVVGPEQPLVDGITDALEKAGILVFGPSKACAQLEGSKAYMKNVAASANVATARFGVFSEVGPAHQFLALLAKKDSRVAIKADGLCGGKGVVLCSSLDESKECVRAFLGDDGNIAPRFGTASKNVIIEEFLDGVELSVFGICDGDDVHLFASARDHKRLFNDDELASDDNPNTGGMGAVGPLLEVHGVNDALMARIRKEIYLPVLSTLKNDGTPYRGFLYAGLMIKNDNVKLLEFNIRFGDPEAQAIFFGTAKDLLPEMLVAARHQKLPKDDGSLRNCVPVACVVLASEGYPQSPEVGREVAGWESLSVDNADVKIFWAGVKSDNSKMKTSGGRVLCVSARGENLNEAIGAAYRGVAKISFVGMQYRKDIGQNL